MLAQLLRQLLGWLAETFLPDDLNDCWPKDDSWPG